MYVSQYLKIATFVPFCDAAPHIPLNQGTGAYGNSMVGTSTYVHHSQLDNPAHIYLCGSHDYHSKSVITFTN